MTKEKDKEKVTPKGVKQTRIAKVNALSAIAMTTTPTTSLNSSPISTSTTSSPVIQSTATTPKKLLKQQLKLQKQQQILQNASSTPSSLSSTPTLQSKKDIAAAAAAAKKSSFGVNSTLMPPLLYEESHVDIDYRNLINNNNNSSIDNETSTTTTTAASSSSGVTNSKIYINNELLLRNFQEQLDAVQYKTLPPPTIDMSIMPQLLAAAKKPKVLKNEQMMELKTPKPVKIPRKIEKMQNRAIKYQTPDLNLRGDWTVADDRLLIDLVQRFPTMEQVYMESIQLAKEWSSAEAVQSSVDESLASSMKPQRKRRHFSKEYTIDQLNERWKQLLYNEKVADEAASMIAINKSVNVNLCPPWSENEIDVLVRNAQPNMNRINFEQLLHGENRPFFHSSRTTRQVEQVYRDKLLTKPIHQFHPYIKFLEDQKKKIKSILSSKQNQLDNNNNSEIKPTTTETITTTDSNEINQPNEKVEVDRMNIDIDINSKQEKVQEQQQEKHEEQLKADSEFIDMNTFLYRKDEDNTIPTSEWDTILSLPPSSNAELQNDFILNPFLDLPKFMLYRDNQEDEKNDLRSIVKVEKEYNTDKEREYKSLALIRGENIRYYMKSKNIIIGRDHSPKNLIDLDLREESDFNVNKISKKHFIIKLKSTQKFVIRNIGKNTVFVNGHPVAPTQTVNLQDLSLIEAASVKLIFEINKSFFLKIRKQLQANESAKNTDSMESS